MTSEQSSVAHPAQHFFKHPSTDSSNLYNYFLAHTLNGGRATHTSRLHYSPASTRADSSEFPATMPNPSQPPKPPPPSLIVEPSIPAACASLLSLRSGGRRFHSASSDGNLPMLTTALTLLEDASRKQRTSSSASASAHKTKSSGSRFWDTVLPVKEGDVSVALGGDGNAEDETAKMNIPCVVCGVRFRKPGHLNMHWRSVHASSADAVYPGKLQPRAAPPSSQAATSAAASNGGGSSNLRIGKAKAGRPYGCPQCPSRFRRGSDRNRHMRMVHAKIRPFECNVCGNHFGRKSFLEAHVSTVHEKQRPFRCDCGAAFGQRSSLTRHVRKIHGTS